MKNNEVNKFIFRIHILIICKEDNMMTRKPTSVGEIHKEEFLEPLSLKISDLAPNFRCTS